MQKEELIAEIKELAKESKPPEKPKPPRWRWIALGWALGLASFATAAQALHLVQENRDLRAEIEVMKLNNVTQTVTVNRLGTIGQEPAAYPAIPRRYQNTRIFPNSF